MGDLKKIDINNYADLEGYIQQAQENLKLIGIESKYKVDFYSNIWELQGSSHTNKTVINFEPFTIANGNYNEEFIILIKYWCSNLLLDLHTTTVKKMIMGLRHILDLTDNLTIKDEGILSERLLSLNQSKIKNISQTVFNLTELYSIFFDKEIIKFLFSIQNFLKSKYKVRDLPSSKDVLIFSKVLTHFFQNKVSRKEYFRWKPVDIWWKLTSVIPMRPIEFCWLKKNSFYIQNDKYYIDIKRCKVKKNEKKIVSKIAISNDIYELLLQYQKEVENQFEYDSEYLFTFNTIIRNNNAEIKDSWGDFISTNFLNTLLVEFYEKIVFGKYNVAKVNEKSNNFYEIEDKLLPGDTRHFAFINLKRQGFHPSEIARIGGHQKITTQEHYFNHVKNLIDLEILGLLYSASFLDDNSTKCTDLEFIAKHFLNEKDSNVKIKLADGYCINESMPCGTEDCWECEFWRISKEEFLNKQEILNIKMKNKEKELEKVTEYLGELYNSIYRKYKSDINGEENLKVKTELFSRAKRIDMVVEQYISLKKIKERVVR